VTVSLVVTVSSLAFGMCMAWADERETARGQIVGWNGE
jgi:ABC-type sulfate transport system permease component